MVLLLFITFHLLIQHNYSFWWIILYAVLIISIRNYVFNSCPRVINSNYLLFILLVSSSCCRILLFILKDVSICLEGFQFLKSSKFFNSISCHFQVLLNWKRVKKLHSVKRIWCMNPHSFQRFSLVVLLLHNLIPIIKFLIRTFIALL